ncbi:MAG: trypsin-like peptidase domain-containing protein [Phycisphaerae bacterium]|nr:trypsin-like peptidase domain-containing protein [Phycisphaerae bacterium]
MSDRRTRPIRPLCARSGAICIMILLAARGMAAKGDDSPGFDPAARITPAVRVFRECSPAVVNLSTTKIVTVQSPLGMGGLFDDIFDFPMRGPRKYKTQSVGSGFLIHADGYLVTNAHVVDRAAECKVTFADGNILDAQEVAIDREHDLAVLKVNARRTLPHLRLGRSDDLMPGETVIAIGNPLGLQHTVTTGVISALDRTLEFGNQHTYRGLIQTDASINPGNSGGPLLNVLGELIGINTAIRGDAQNIGFAIPVDRLSELLPEMLDIERLRQVVFGIHFDAAGTRGGSADHPIGVRIGRVDPDTPAAAADVQAGDVVVAIDNQQTRDFIEAFSLLERTPVGQMLKLDIVKKDGKRRTIEVPLAALKPQDASRLLKQFFSLGLREMNADDLARIGVSRPIGLVVTSAGPGNEATRGQLQPGDIITKFGGISVAELAPMAHLMKQVNPGDRIPFQVLRIRGDAIVRFETALQAR